MRRHGWQRPLHSLQIVGMSVYCFLVASFYCFLGLFLGSRIADITLSAIFSFVALAVMLLFVRCCAIDPTDRSRLKKKTKTKTKTTNLPPRGLNYGFLLAQIFTSMERKLLQNCIGRRRDPWITSAHMDPLLPFPLVIKDDSVSPDPLEDDISFCYLCNFQVKKHSKHCRTCNRCVEGFDHHCRWLNNCVGKKNYRTFILLMIFVLLMLLIEGGTAVAVFIRCFADRRGIEQELERKFYTEFPRGVLAAISVLLVILTAYGSAALGQLFFFHVVLIRKGMQTYDYIMAMKEENRSMELELSEDSDDSDFSSEEGIDFDSPAKPAFTSKFMCGGQRTDQNPQILMVRIDREPKPSTSTKKQGFRASINPWTLIKMSSEKALIVAEKARERLLREKAMVENESLKPLPLETKSGPSMTPEEKKMGKGTGSSGLTPLIIKGGRLSGSPGLFSSPRKRISSSPLMARAVVSSPKQRYKSNFDLKLTEVSRELETYISKQVLCSVLKEEEMEESPR